MKYGLIPETRIPSRGVPLNGHVLNTARPIFHRLSGIMAAHLLAGSFFLFGSCTSQRIAMDLVTYVNQGILNIAQLEGTALEGYASVTGENFTNAEAVRLMLQDVVIPNYGRFLQLLRGIHPKEDEIRRLHGIYVWGAERMYAGFRTKLLGIERDDEAIMMAGNREIEDGRMETERWREALKELYRKYGIVEKGR